jgi:hypothetical protein
MCCELLLFKVFTLKVLVSHLKVLVSHLKVLVSHFKFQLYISLKVRNGHLKC